MRVTENDDVNRWLEVLSTAKKNQKNAKMSSYLLKLALKPKRQRISVNLSKLDKFTSDNENIVVPGKLLGEGKISKKINISAMEYSEQAKEKLKESKCHIVDIGEMVKKEGVRIIV